MSHQALLNDLEQGLLALGLDTTCAAKMLEYLRLLEHWNQAYNLTAVRDMQAMVSRHLLDSLAILPWVKGPRVLDVGSGAGFPGLPIALMRSDLFVVLLDSNGKKTRFLNEVKRALSLKTVEIVQGRVEHYQPSEGFDTICSRALSELSQMMAWTERLLRPQGRCLAMKGQYPQEELSALHFPYRVETYTVPGLEGQRSCVIVEKG